MDARIGTDAKGDCIAVATSEKGPRLSVTTKASQLLESGLRNLAEETLSKLGVEDVCLDLADAGSLDYVVAARIEAAVRVARPQDGRPIVPEITRRRSDADRPRRSRLYAPGSNPRLLAGIDIHGADCVLLDLEDSVPLAEKAAARILVKHVLAAVAFTEEVWVRINGLDAGGEEDLQEVLLGRPNGVCLPKAESAADVARLAERLEALEKEFGLPAGSTWIMPIIETGKGVLHAEEIAGAHARIVMIAFGAEDYTRDVGALRSRRSQLFARSQIIAACAAAGIQASDTVYADVADDEGLAKEAELARELGFDGKGAINPRQLEAIHRAFTPSDQEVERARAIVEAAREAEGRGLGAVSLDGKMIDKPVLERAERLMRYAEKLSTGGGSNA